MAEVDRLLVTIQKDVDTGNKAIDTKKTVNICVGSIINQLLFGYRFVGDTEAEFYELKSYLAEQNELASDPIAQLLSLMPSKYLKMIPFVHKTLNRLIESDRKVFKFLKNQVDQLEKCFKIEGEPEDATNYVQAFLIEKAKRERNGNIGEFTYEQLVDMCSDLWGAGQETTATTTNFGILHLMLNPNVQKKMQAELDRVVGPYQKVTLNDRPNLPYTNAVCNETQRNTNLLPMNVIHVTTKDVSIQGHKIKKGTLVVPQISNVLIDEKVFPNPEKFQPERFLDDNGKLKKVEEFMPFSVGKRQCLGESLARNEIFLFLANLFHEFKIKPNDPNQTTQKINAFLVQPPDYKCDCERRIPIIQ